jgi:hypothetical protein
MVVEVKLVDGDRFVELGLLEPEPNGIMPAMFCLYVSELVEDKEGIAVFLVGLLDDGFKVLGHNLQPKIDKLFFEMLEISHPLFSF